MFAALRSSSSRLASSCGSTLAAGRAGWSQLPGRVGWSPLLPAPDGVRGYFTKNRLGKPMRHRVDMLRTMVTQLIHYERIRTTLPKAKELRRLADRVVTFAKKNTNATRKAAKYYVTTEYDRVKLFTILAHRFKDRPGGYSRVLQTYRRAGDSAPMAYIEFIDRPVEEKRMPWRLQEQPRSVVPGRSGRKYYQYVPGPPGRRKPFDGRREVPLLPLFDNPLTPEYEAPPRQDAYRWPPDRGSSK